MLKTACSSLLVLVLAAAPAWAEKGSVSITSQPGGAKIYINGQRKGTTSTQPGQALFLDLEEGEYQLEAKTDDGATAKIEVFVPANGVQPVHLVLPPFTDADFVSIPGGCFQMGSPSSEADRSGDETQHRVCVDGFKLGKTEITQAQWQAVMGNNPSEFKGPNRPVETVSWDDVQEFLRKLGGQYRLPTEAEWEYAARAGTTTPFSTGNCISTDQANYDGNYPYEGCSKGEYREKTVDVASFPANAFGLYDMHGNVWEWTCSAYTAQYDGNETSCKNGANKYVLRGGSWDSYAHNLRAADRVRLTPDYRNSLIGFRVVFQ